MRLLVTGGAGFIGSSFVRLALSEGHEVVVLDKLTYSGNPANLKEVEAKVRLVRGDIADEETVRGVLGSGGLDAVVNFAAETHVDRSILDAADCVRTNVDGVRVLLDAILGLKERPRFMQVSTDEVYGSAVEGRPFVEETPLAPNSPYAASKAAADLLVRAYRSTHDMDVIVTRCSNNYGPRQYPEKLVPLFVTNAMDERPLPLYGDGLNVRDWIHVDDHGRAILLCLERAPAGALYNVGAANPRSNIEITRLILAELGKSESLITHVKDRPGHDRRYEIDASRLRRETGWEPEVPFERGLAEPVRWYAEHREWWEPIRSGEFRRWYERQYGKQ